MAEDPDFAAMCAHFECVEINRPNDMNFNDFRFDYDLTMSIVLAHPDGTVYHRYGGRETVSPMQMPTLLTLMEATLDEHAVYCEKPAPPAAKPKSTMSQTLPALRSEMGDIANCNHCHYIAQAEILLARKKHEWTSASFWVFPEVERLGLRVDQNAGMTIEAVEPESPAEEAGLLAGDKLLYLKTQRVRTRYDAQFVLHDLPHGKCKLPVIVDRGGNEIKAELKLVDGWKITDPADYVWRTKNGFTKHMQVYIPAPGIIGVPLSEEELAELDLEPDVYALQVDRLLEAPYNAGIRRGDVILHVVKSGKKILFHKAADFYKTFDEARLKRQPVKLVIDRFGQSLTLALAPRDLEAEPNFAPDPPFGLNFCKQGSAVAVSFIIPDSPADKAGMIRGDVLVKYDGKTARNFAALLKAIDATKPGQAVTFTVRRAGGDKDITIKREAAAAK